MTFKPMVFANALNDVIFNGIYCCRFYKKYFHQNKSEAFIIMENNRNHDMFGQTFCNKAKV